MAKLYLFGIGGTGSRVIKSLAMLLAAGVEANGYEIVPLLIDPDSANGDLTRTVEILKNYQQIRSRLDFPEHSVNRFFKTPLSDVCQNFRFELNDIRNDKFKDYIDFANLSESNKALIRLLFSDENLNSDMEVGFKGNPNIGSVVLNQFRYSKDFRNFASSFSQNDRIFIISSIFGGTGAAGFPILLKNIRNADQSLPTCALLKNAPIGAITILPYFGITPDDESKIDKSTFISKTKAALSYYEDNVSGNNSLNALYYLGDKLTKDYENHEGSASQKNDAHFIELSAALAVLDFAGIDDPYLATADGTVENPLFKEFGIVNDNDTVTFSDLGHTAQITLKKSLTQYLLFTLYLKNHINDALDLPWATGAVKIDRHFLSQPFYGSYLKNFNQHFFDWLREMRYNRRSFAPLNLDIGNSNLFSLVEGIRPSEKFLQKGSNYGRFDYILSKIEPQIGNPNAECKFMSLFYKATEKLVAEKFNF